jgi:FkbM family methyltransferase
MSSAPTDRPQPFVLTATDHGPMIVSRLDFRHIEGSRYIGVGAQLLSHGHYDPGDVERCLNVLSLLRHYRAPNGERPIYALDGGANVGVHSLEWGRHLHGWGEVLAVEAQERLFYALCGNVCLNNHLNVTCTWAALDAKPGRLPQALVDYTQPGSYGSVGMHLVPGDDSGARVRYAPELALRATTVDQLCPQLDFLKLDLEGMEILALEGATRVLTEHRPVVFAEHLKCGVEPLRQLLEERGYVVLVDSNDVWAVPEGDMILKHLSVQSAT